MRVIGMRSIHTIARSPAVAVGNETPVTVYDSPEFKQLQEATSRNFHDDLFRSEHKAKFFSLIPFFVESRITGKHFVLKMELFSNAGYLKMHVLRLSGVQEHWVPLKQIVPITPYDYWCASWLLWFK